MWFDVSVVLAIFAIGNIYFGHFEEHKPKWKRALKVVLLTTLIGLLSASGLRWASFGLIGVLLIAVVYIHGIWLPRRGVDGLTGEPRERYYEVKGFKKPE